MKSKLKKISVVLLIDFNGHPSLGDDNMNNLRYKYLQDIAFDPNYRVVFMSNHNATHDKLNEIQKMVVIENMHKWISIDPGVADTISASAIEELLATHGLRPQNIVIGGCNTAGCVISTKGWSAIHWAKKGYDTTICLPMCADYQMPGIDSFEKSITAFTVLYNRIKTHNLTDDINIQADLIHINLGQGNFK